MGEITADVGALRAIIETERERFEVPGVAVAVVLGGEVILAEGFGLADLATDTKTTADTYFPIASDTKCFTAATICQLADEGLLDLDAPLRDHIPWFELSDPLATPHVSARDLLAHRTGLPRHDVVWYGATTHSYEQIARSLKHLEMSRQLRQTWQYNNLGFTTAGYLTEVLTGQTWEDAVTTRLLKPAGMQSTTFGVDGLNPGAVATPYRRIGDVPVAQDLPTADSVGPAGSIVSTASDMGQWLLARLGAKPEVLGSPALAQLHGPSMVGTDSVSEFPERQSLGYALGCAVEAYRGMRMIEHGGNLVGFSSMVTVVPEHGIGIAILANDHGTPLRDALPLVLIDEILSLESIDWGGRLRELQLTRRAGAEATREHHASAVSGFPPSRPLAEYAGCYLHPAYGTFTVSVSPDGTVLVPDFHGLGSKIALRHRARDAWDLTFYEFDELAVPLVFAQGGDGEITGLSVSLEAMVGAIPFARQPSPLSPDLAAALPGSYAMGSIPLVVRERGSSLVVSVPGNGELTLVHLGGTRFSTVEMPAAIIDVAFTPDEGVTRLVVDPVGVFLPAPARS